MIHTSLECPVIFRLNCVRHVKSDYRCSMSEYWHVIYSETNLMFLSPWKPCNNSAQYFSFHERSDRITIFLINNVLNMQERLDMNIKGMQFDRDLFHKNIHQLHCDMILNRAACIGDFKTLPRETRRALRNSERFSSFKDGLPT